MKQENYDIKRCIFYFDYGYFHSSTNRERAMNLKKNAKKIGIGIGVIFLLIQFIQPNRENPVVDSAVTLQAKVNVPGDVDAILRRACYDCHSSETKWPFYSYIAPASWLVSYDVKEGRREMNFSEWGNYKKKKQARRLSAIPSEIENGAMPMPKYLLLHSEARLSDADKAVLIHWAKTEYSKIMGSESEE